jgi:DNA-binding protein YbaB
MTSSDEWIARVQADSLARLEAVGQMQRELEGLVGEATSPDRLVRVTVSPAGALTALHIADEATALDGERLGALILETAARATAEASARMKQVVGAVIAEEDLDALVAGAIPPSTQRAVDAELRVRRDGEG